MDDLTTFILGGFLLVYFKNLMKQKDSKDRIEMLGGGDVIDLTNVKPNTAIEEDSGKIVFDNVSTNKFDPMFEYPLNAKKFSPTNSVHLVVPGLMPAPDRVWKDYSSDKIFYMPNDLKPHFHGDAQHHMTKGGFEVSKVFSVKNKDFVNVPNKKLKTYRDKITDFNMGEASTPIETWIHWMIPYNQKEYPKLIVKKNSIIWWDFNKFHNLNYVTEENYNNNKADANDFLIKLDNKELQIIVTIMDKVGTFYFLCSIGQHAALGHKIIIEVIE